MRSSLELRRPRRVAAVVVVAAGALVAAGCGSVGHLGAGGNIANGKTQFTQKCGSCHILEDAGTAGTIGPNLDAGFFQYRKDMEGDQASAKDTERIEDTIRQVVRGQIAYPTVDPSTSAPGMPADIVTGQDADDVATYVARVAGIGDTADTTGKKPDGGEADPKALFGENCASCHILAAAGASGNVGPNLDQLKPDQARVAGKVTEGGGGMPAFAGLLSQQQIDAIAAYVADNAG